MRWNTTILLSLIILMAGLLRTYQLGSIPVSMYWDEVAIGLDAYSISESGRDINDYHWLQPVLGSYGDFKAPVYIWLTVPFVKIMGLSASGIRLPSAILSTLSILMIFLLARQVMMLDRSNSSRDQNLTAIITALALAISPWAAHFGRVGFESSISVFWFLACLVSFYTSLISKKSGYILLTSIFAIIGVYSYYPLRILLPVVLLLLSLLHFKDVKNLSKPILVAAIALFIGANIPIYTSQYYDASQEYRMSNSVLTNDELIVESSAFLERYDSALWARMVFHRYWFRARDFADNYMSHFSPDFLFVSGDSQLRQHTGYGGMLFLAWVPLLILGLVYVIKHVSQPISKLVLVLLLTAPMMAGFKYESPNASRAIYLIIPLAMLIGLGGWQLSKMQIQEHWKKILIRTVSVLVIINATLYWHDYFTLYPGRSARAWVQGYSQAATYIRDNYWKFSKMDLTGRYWNPPVYIYYELPFLLSEIRGHKRALLDNHIQNFGMPGWNEYLENLTPNDQGEYLPELLMLAPDEAFPERFEVVDRFYFENGDVSIVLGQASYMPEKNATNSGEIGKF